MKVNEKAPSLKQVVVSEDHHQKIVDISYAASSQGHKVTMRDIVEFAIDNLIKMKGKNAALLAGNQFAPAIWEWKHKEHEDG